METDSGSEIPVTCVNEALQVLPSSVTTLPCSDEGRSLAKRLCCAETSKIVNKVAFTFGALTSMLTMFTRNRNFVFLCRLL